MRRGCHKCLFFDLCSGEGVLGICEHYAPCDDTEEEDGRIDRLIKRRRDAFRDEWHEYVSVDFDELFF